MPFLGTNSTEALKLSKSDLRGGDMSVAPPMVLLVGETARSSLHVLQWLKRRGCHSQLAQSYRDACNLMVCTQFDLVLSQYQLPDRTAFPLLEWVEDGSLWLKMLERGKRCVGAPVLRSNDLKNTVASALDAAVESYEKESVGAG